MITKPLQLLRSCIEKGLNFEEFQKRSSALFDCEKSRPSVVGRFRDSKTPSVRP